MKHRFAVLLIALVPAASAAPEPLSRARAVDAALEANPEVRKGHEEQSRLEGLVTEARADALPELTVSGSATRYRDPSLLNSSSFDAFPPELRESLKPIPANLYEGIAELRQTLFSFKLGKAIRAARLGTSFGREEVRRARQGVALQAVIAYNDYVLSIEKIHVAEKAVRQKEKHLEMAQNRRAAGVATDLDVLRSRVDLENQRTQLLRIRGQADLSRGRLNAVMVRPIAEPIEPTDALEYIPYDVSLDDVVREAWGNRPEARAAALAEQIREQLVGVAQAEARPSLEFHGAWGYSVRRPQNFFEGDFEKWNASVTLKIPVFDGLRTAGKVAQARAERSKAAQDKVALENQIRLEAKSSVDRLAVARSIFEVAELNVDQAQQALDMTQANYKHGAATTLDVLDAQAALTLAESNRLEALYEHANARATLRYVMARDVLDASEGKQP
jgi:HAE1 family hydrophobic/amphiphilic exporter-1